MSEHLTPTPSDDEHWIRHCLRLAREAREQGNHPFGALLVGPQGQLRLEARNTVETERDITGHAELRLMRAASQRYDADFLAQCSLYSSTEPCPMCAGAIFWGNVRRVVFGLSEAGLYAITGRAHEEILSLPCSQLFQYGAKAIEVVGPVLPDEAAQVHHGFWS